MTGPHGDRTPGTDRATGHEPTRQAVEDVARASYGRLVAYLASVTGDLAAAEDALSEAFVAALRTWPDRGVPDRPDSWLVTAARRNLVDAARRRGVAARALPEIARVLSEAPDPPEGSAAESAVPDKRLELLFACTHPAIDAGIRSPLMLQAVLGLDAARIGAAFLVPATTMGQRLVRAKAKIRQAGIPFSVPPADRLPERVPAVLDAVYAAYGAGWDEAHAGDRLVREALRLAEVVAALLPDEPEAHGLLALLLHSDARADARRGPDGRFVPLDEQDVTLWSREAMERAESHLARALALRRLGPYQLHAAIQSAHNQRVLTGDVDWPGVARLYDGLVTLTPTVGALVARARAHGMADGPHAALRLLGELPADRVASYQPYWVTRADALRRAGDALEADVALQRALALTTDVAVREHLSALTRRAAPD